MLDKSSAADPRNQQQTGFLAFRLTSFNKHSMILKHHFALQVGEFVLFLCNFDESKNLYLSFQVHFPGEFGLVL